MASLATAWKHKGAFGLFQASRQQVVEEIRQRQPQRFAVFGVVYDESPIYKIDVFKSKACGLAAPQAGKKHQQ